jgi:hypothetical protein
MVCSKKPQPKVAALNKELQKEIEGKFLAYLEGHISHQKFTDAIFQ